MSRDTTKENFFSSAGDPDVQVSGFSSFYFWLRPMQKTAPDELSRELGDESGHRIGSIT